MAKKPNLRKLTSLGSRGVASVSDQAAAAAVNFLVSVFIGRHLGAEALGLFAITNVFVLLVRSLQMSVVLEPMSVFGPRRSENYNAYFGFLVGLETVSILFVSIVTAAGGALAWALGLIARDMFMLMLASCAYVNFLCFQLFIRWQFYVDHRQYLATVQSVSFLLLVALGLAALWRVEGLSVVDIYNLMILCSVLVCAVQSGRFWRHMAKPSRAEVRDFARDHWSFGKWILLAVPFGILTYQGFFVIVGFALSNEATGLLKASEALIAPFTQVVIGLQLMLVPMASRNVDALPLVEQKRLAIRISLAFVAVSLVYSAIVFFFREYAIVLLFGEKMRDAIPLLAILSAFPLFRGLPMAPAVILSARKQSDLRFVSQVASTVLALIASVPLIVYFGLTGAAIGMVVSQAMYVVTNWACLWWLWRRDERQGLVLA